MIVRSLSLFILFLIALSCTKTIPETPKAVLVIHGGAGWISRESVSDSKNAYITTLETALIKGRDVIKNGGSSLDAVQRANSSAPCPLRKT